MTANDRPQPASADVVKIASPMIEAIEHAWAAIRANHPDLPPVVVIMGGGLVPGGIKLGHWAADTWAHREHNTENALDAGAEAAARYSELFVGAEGLARQPHEVLATLLHEAAHGLAHARKIQDTSRQGRWHNARFATLAAEVGITVTKDPKIGYSITSIPDETTERYMGTIMELSLAITHVRALPAMVKVTAPADPVPVGGGVAVAPAPVRRRPGARCSDECGREVHIARKDLAEAAIVCGRCLTPFAYRD
jgi:hypothetical protein